MNIGQSSWVPSLLGSFVLSLCYDSINLALLLTTHTHTQCMPHYLSFLKNTEQHDDQEQTPEFKELPKYHWVYYFTSSVSPGLSPAQSNSQEMQKYSVTELTHNMLTVDLILASINKNFQSWANRPLARLQTDHWYSKHSRDKNCTAKVLKTKLYLAQPTNGWLKPIALHTQAKCLLNQKYQHSP